VSYLATEPHVHAGKSIETGHCVAYVQKAAGAPPTQYWRRGERVRDAEDVPTGTAIATFSQRGRYENRMDGSSHAAILVFREDQGLTCWDQWKGKLVSQRLIRYTGGVGPACDDGDQYYIIEPTDNDRS
jgi:hypothetical protein